MSREFLVCKDAEAVSREGAKLFVKIAAEKASAGGRFSVALSGGSTPKTMFEMLASDEFRDQVDWDKVDLFWGDERSVAPDHKDSNYRMTREALIDHVPIPAGNVRRIEGEHDVAAGAASYEEMLKSYFGLSEGQLPRFDLVYLGMGDDGHTASLFPGTQALCDTDRLVVPNYVDKFQTYRITLTAPALNNGRLIVFLLAGAGKADRLHEVIEGPAEPDRLPSQRIAATNGRLLFVADEGAVAKLSRKALGK